MLLAHESILNVDEEDCIYHTDEGNFDDLRWYNLKTGNKLIHIPDSIYTIKYHIFNNCDLNSFYSWDTDVSPTIASQILSSIEESILSWNDVYYYTYANNSRVSHKLINLIPGGETDSNILIYPGSDNLNKFEIIGSDENAIAYTERDDDYDTIVEVVGNIQHIHCTKWKMYFNVIKFDYNSNQNAEFVDSNRLRAGAHEIGHVLGLNDNNCNDEADIIHSQQLMGYIPNSYPYHCSAMYKNAVIPSYYDIAGVEITRGIHDDDDHIWLKEDYSKVRCLICNSIRENVQIINNTYEGQQLYQFDTNCHGTINNPPNSYHYDRGNMILLATNGIQDYFKCLNCKHVQKLNILNRFEIANSFYQQTEIINISTFPNLSYATYQLNIQNQITLSVSFQLNSNNIFMDIEMKIIDDYFNSIQYLSNTYSNNKRTITYNLPPGQFYVVIKINGIDYDYPNIIFTLKNDTHYHNYNNSYSWINNNQHRAYCGCGSSTIQPHVVQLIGNQPSNTCLLCNGPVGNGFIVYGNGGILLTDNGSYISPNGIIVLNEKDIDYFLDYFNFSIHLFDNLDNQKIIPYYSRKEFEIEND